MLRILPTPRGTVAEYWWAGRYWDLVEEYERSIGHNVEAWDRVHTYRIRYPEPYELRAVGPIHLTAALMEMDEKVETDAERALEIAEALDVTPLALQS